MDGLDKVLEAIAPSVETDSEPEEFEADTPPASPSLSPAKKHPTLYPLFLCHRPPGS
uniref:Uncharacterized protein n=1 Tax=Anguilla anguilla TaxID=7936 RepID=A0A0E9SLL1_ANGAN